MQPTILVDVPPNALVAIEETFGPVFAVVRVPDVDAAAEAINTGPSRLGSSVFSATHGETNAARLRVRMTSQNPGRPFGGGREHGDEGLLEFDLPAGRGAGSRRHVRSAAVRPPRRST